MTELEMLVSGYSLARPDASRVRILRYIENALPGRVARWDVKRAAYGALAPERASRKAVIALRPFGRAVCEAARLKGALQCYNLVMNETA